MITGAEAEAEGSTEAAEVDAPAAHAAAFSSLL